MSDLLKVRTISKKVAAVLVFGRPPLAFGAMVCGVSVMLEKGPLWYTLGVLFLLTAMGFDLVDGWFSVRFRPHSKLAHVADRIMDKVVFSIVFPLIAVGAMWQVQKTGSPTNIERFHAIFLLLLCIVVLIRDNFAHFMKSFTDRRGQESMLSDVNRIRTIIAAPVGALLYAHSFYVPGVPFIWLEKLGQIPLAVLFFIEISFFIINFGSIAQYCRKYGSNCLDELCLGDRALKQRILAFFPNALTVMNALMGCLAIFFANQGRMREAYLILIGAALFDKLDGALARRLGLIPTLKGIRRRRQIITFGGVLDDIADTVSFCIAPGIMFYLAMKEYGVHQIFGLPISMIGAVYTLSGIIRLVYFTLDKNPIPGFFKGLPTPAAALFVTSFFPLFALWILDSPQTFDIGVKVSAIAILLASVLMNTYFLHYIHFGRMMGRHPWLNWAMGLSILVFFFTPYFGYAAAFYLGLYLVSPLFTWKVDPNLAAREIRTASSKE